ncbi:MAG TPA: hypothetical protein VLC48_04785 [Gemmatimonadota bacterium]|nr:hypothetical protein [Gemmatimonadota bacterium]
MSRRFLALGAGCALLVAMAACDSGLDVNPADFDQLPWLADLDYEQVVPAASFDYWEFRYVLEVGDQEPDSVIGAGGSLSRAELDTTIIAVLDTLTAAPGFGIECLPGLCYKYVVSVAGPNIEIWNTPAELEAFLGTIGSWQEAAMLVNAYDYYWDTEDRAAGGIREVSDGYEALVLELVSTCVPVQVNRSLVRVTRAGVVTEISTEEWSKVENGCI